ncbi:hypothetical protein PGTUg99_021760 [Puccinia graminis f. sp. tritici]|uniref:Dyp-type peroxidase n=1 Tax=Puccinia graminis f. sp. tritici TaxID=56615 RepID=A0A5B0RSH0_PUCGR|nr:hypothetical protein PGTUg99_021760 [Puccinia graminis f. sp. tritici]
MQSKYEKREKMRTPTFSINNLFLIVLPSLLGSHTSKAQISSSRVDLKNVQGDVIIGLQKRQEAFWFGTLRSDPSSIEGFRKNLKTHLLPLITTTQGVIDAQKVIDDHQRKQKKGEAKQWLPITHVNLGFAYNGLKKLGLKPEEIPTGKDGVFSKGQKLDAVKNLGDPMIQATKKLNTWSRDFLGEVNTIDFVVLITAPDSNLLNQKLHQVRKMFNGYLSHSFLRQGNVRPGDQYANEHFGFPDAISMAKIKGVNARAEDRKAGIVEPGVILLGYPSANGNSTAPDANQAWLKDGSFMAFRELRQLVPEFHHFCDETAKNMKNLNVSGDFIGARIVGRWKSGAPLTLAPKHDNPALSTAQDFDYSDELKQERCPYAAHIRKSNPRNGIQGADPQKTTLPHLMIRNSIPYGPELTGEEKYFKRTIENRGLLFVAYQSDIVAGFQFVQKAWCNNPSFPPQTALNVSAGLDLLIGQHSDGSPRTAQNIIPLVPGGNIDPRNTVTAFQPFVVPLGSVRTAFMKKMRKFYPSFGFLNMLCF